jgi:GTP-binding protein
LPGSPHFTATTPIGWQRSHHAPVPADAPLQPKHRDKKQEQLETEQAQFNQQVNELNAKLAEETKSRNSADKAKIDADVEKLAVTMALSQIERADIVVLVIDAEIGPAEQDARIAGMVEQAGRGLVIALNKSDLVTGDAAKAQLRELTKDTFHFLAWAPVATLSAQRGDGVDRLLDLVDTVAREHKKRIQTAQLNRFFAEVIEEMPPPLHHGRAVRIHYLTQATTRPPTFVLWANTPDGLAPSYKRFLANRLRERYGFRGTPIRIAIKAKHDRHKPNE